MIGVIHRDPDLERLLASWLESVEPDVITLELSCYGLAFRQSRGGDLAETLRASVNELLAQGRAVDKGALDALFAYIAVPSEFAVASRFSQAHAVPLHLVDTEDQSRSHLAHMEELLARDNLVKLLCGGARTEEGFERAAARLFFEKGVSLFSYADEMHARDLHMQTGIRRLMESHPGARFLHICGWQHLGDPDAIFAPLNPRKAFIYDKTLRV